MSRRLARTVIVRDDVGTAVAFGPKDDVPEWAVPLITNPRAWVGGDPPELEQLVRCGATADEVTALLAVWDVLPEDERLAIVDDHEPQRDSEIREQLAAIRAEVAEKGMTFADALRVAAEHGGVVDDKAPAPLATPTMSFGTSTTMTSSTSTSDAPPADPSLVEVPPPAVEVVEPPAVVEKPARNGSKAAWRAYAVSQGMSEDDADAKNRDELADFYG